MELLPKWELTGTLPAFSDDDSSTVIEMTYKLYNTMQTLIGEYNSFADSVNSKILTFENQYHSDFESFTSSIRQEIQEFTNTFNSNIANLNSRISEVDSKYQTSTTSLQNQINTINNILASDDVNLDTLQELVNALKNNVSSINDLFTELAKKVNITDYNAKINSIESNINNISSRLTDVESHVSNLSENTYRKNEIDTKVSTIDTQVNAIDKQVKNLSTNTYTKSEIDTKVNTINSNITSLSDNTYTKAEVDDLVANSGGGSKKYLHLVRVSGYDASYHDLIVNEEPTPYTEATYSKYLYDKGINSESNKQINRINTANFPGSSSKTSIEKADGIWSDNGTSLKMHTTNKNFNIIDGVLNSSESTSLKYNLYFAGDVVYEL